MILVTGGTGMVGAHLLYHLALENEQIIAIYRSESKLKAVENVFSYYTENTNQLFKKIIWEKADIEDTISLEELFQKHKITQVYHAAALVSFNPKDYKKMRQVNIQGTMNIVNFCIDFNVEKLCYVSSVATLSKKVNQEFLDESCDWNPEEKNYGYAISKYGAEMEVWRGTQEGLNAVIVNPGVILGAGFWKNGTGDIFSKFHKGFPYYTEGITGFVGVKDTVKAMIQLMKSDIKDERFVLVSENISFKDLFFSIAGNFQKKKPSKKVSEGSMKLLAVLDKIRCFFTNGTPLLTEQSVKSAHSKTYYNSDKIKQELSFDFEPISTTISEICTDFNRDK
ncbi:NAD-dependent epimerase/dehydratase family protein [Aureivirga sp. CE67]|uniref:NAD-dependent epimerase/dehydratase family protein n=1 Tax=Aureivirga sp. CE67 TaxID=1788983 RepID=UPI0018CB0B7D|nr:NAD-dependent epimerase/dehydratase family protein [Aureivirga sp. CE67]